MPYIGNIVQDFSVSTAMLNSDSVTSIKVLDGTIVNADINDSAAIAMSKLALSITNSEVNASAAIAGSKISPIFSSHIEIQNASPKITFTDTDNNPDHRIQNTNGTLNFHDVTNDVTRLAINTDGHIDIAGNLDVGAGIDVTGAITGTGDLTIDTNTLHVDSSNNRVGIGTTSPSNIIHATGSNSSTGYQFINTHATSGFGVRLVGGGTTADRYALRVDDAAENERFRINANGNVGIGTASPTALLHVDSDSTTAGIRVTGDGNAFLELDADSSIAGTQIGFIDFKLAGTVEANIAVNESVSGNPLELNSATNHNITLATGGGSVGIGTASPGGSLDIGGNTDNNIQAIMTRASDTNFQLQFRNESSSNNVGEPQGKFGLFYQTTDIVGLQFARGSSTGAGSLIFTTGGTGQMRLNSSGYLGIGTTHIEAPLSVARDVAASASFNLNNNTMMLRNSGSADTASRTSLYFRTHAADNKLSPSGIRCIAGSNYQSILAFHTNGNGNGTGHIENYERMRIDGAGAVGIGTTSPGYILHVKGGIVDQTAVFDNSKTSDGDINYIGVRLNDGTKGVALFGHTGHTTTGSQAAWMGLGGDDVAGGVGVKCFRGGAVQMNGTLRVNTSTQYGKLHVLEGAFNPNNSSWLSEVSYVASGSFGGGYSLLDGSKGYSMYCHGSGNHFSIQHHSSTTATASGGVELLNAATSWTSASDEREKENLVTISDAITKIKTLRTVIGNYTWQPDIKHAFLIAQDVQAVLPEAVDIRNTYEETEKQRLGLRYTEVIPLLVKAVQELSAKVDELESKLK